MAPDWLSSSEDCRNARKKRLWRGDLRGLGLSSRCVINHWQVGLKFRTAGHLLRHRLKALFYNNVGTFVEREKVESSSASPHDLDSVRSYELSQSAQRVSLGRTAAVLQFLLIW